MSARLAAALVLMLGAGAACGAELGRLFFTPEQRATLDNMRQKNVSKEAAGDKEPAAAPMPQNVSIDGVVRRSDGKDTVWLNNRAVTAPQAGGIGVATGKNDNRVRLSVPESGRRFDLKVGQTAELVGGTIAENYARPAASPKPEAKAAPPASSQPTAPESSARNMSKRAGERDAEDDSRPKRGREPR